jgi:regulator of protease activity HflC (stomatin/prohibitin superfamily)
MDVLSFIGISAFAFVVIVILSAIKIVPEYKRLVLFRLGKSKGERGPGIVIVYPMIDQVVWVDLRESYLEIPEQTCITKDNAPISVDFLIYWKVVNPTDSIVQVKNFAGAAQGIATTTLRAVVGDIPLDDVLAKREQINEVLRTKLDEITSRWGVKITSVEIREIQPPTEVQTAMTKQMAAERNRRAVVTEAEGTRQAAITIAEGEKQAAVLKADGKRQAQMLEAEGYAKALESIFGAAKSIDDKTMGLQYLETLKALGASPSTKYIFPMEFTSLLKPFIGNIEETLKKR